MWGDIRRRKQKIKKIEKGKRKVDHPHANSTNYSTATISTNQEIIAVKGVNPNTKAPRFARVGGGSFVVRSLPPAFCREAVSTT